MKHILTSYSTRTSSSIDRINRSTQDRILELQNNLTTQVHNENLGICWLGVDLRSTNIIEGFRTGDVGPGSTSEGILDILCKYKELVLNIRAIGSAKEGSFWMFGLDILGGPSNTVALPISWFFKIKVQ